MADYLIKRNGVYSTKVEINNIPNFDTANFTARCHLRDNPGAPGNVNFVPTEPVVFTVSNVAGSSVQFEIALNATQTASLVSTDGFIRQQFPLLDFEITETATGDIWMTESQTVEIREAQTYG